MNDQAVIDYLKSNPKFLQKNPDILDYLVPPKDTSGGRGVVDFRHYMVEKLKADKKEVLNSARDIIEISRENMNTLARVHDAVLKILEARTFDHFLQTLSVDLPGALDCDVVTLVMEAHEAIPPTDMRALRLVPQGALSGYQKALLQSNIQGSSMIFGEAAGLVQSQAILRIDRDMPIPPSLLAFGSRNPEMFAEGMGVDLINFLCGVTERLVTRWQGA